MRRISTRRVLSCLPALLVLVLLGTAAYADTTTVSGGTSVTMQFPVTRSGDLRYEAALNYFTLDGTALAGTDYTAASGQIVIPAGAASATIPVTITPHSGSGPDLAFQLQLDSTTRVGPAPQFADQQQFAVGAVPFGVTSADVNGDGKPDQITSNTGDNTLSVMLNTTTPGAGTPSFASQQEFAVEMGPNSVTSADVNGDGKARFDRVDLRFQRFRTAQYNVAGFGHAELRHPAAICRGKCSLFRDRRRCQWRRPARPGRSERRR